MKIKFCCNNHANIHSKKCSTFKPEDLGFTKDEWMSFTDEEKNKYAFEWAMEDFEVWYEEIE